jgi:hypothetical protein
MLARVRQIRPTLNLPALAGWLVRLGQLCKSVGTLHGSVAVWVTGATGRHKALALVARKNGPRVATAPAVLLARRILAQGPPACGAYPCLGFLTLAEIAAFLAPFDIVVAHGDYGHWSS